MRSRRPEAVVAVAEEGSVNLAGLQARPRRSNGPLTRPAGGTTGRHSRAGSGPTSECAHRPNAGISGTVVGSERARWARRRAACTLRRARQSSPAGTWQVGQASANAPCRNCRCVSYAMSMAASKTEPDIRAGALFTEGHLLVQGRGGSSPHPPHRTSGSPSNFPRYRSSTGWNAANRPAATQRPPPRTASSPTATRSPATQTH